MAPIPKALPCPKCGKFTFKTGPVCTRCNARYHKLCANLNYPIVPKNWLCYKCCDNDSTSSVHEIDEPGVLTPSCHKKSLLINSPGNSIMVVDAARFAELNTPVISAQDSLSEAYNDAEEIICYDNTHNIGDEDEDRLLLRIKRLMDCKLGLFKTELLSEIKSTVMKSSKEAIESVRQDEMDETSLLLDALNDNDTEKDTLQREIDNLKQKLSKLENDNRILREQVKTLTSETLSPINEDPICNHKEPTNIIHNPIKASKKFLLFGDQQIKGVANKIRDSNLYATIGDCEISAFIKPYAKSRDVLSSVSNADIQCDDYVLIAIGANDSTINDIVYPLRDALDNINSKHVFVLNTAHNPYLDIVKLNSKLSSITSTLPNIKNLDMKYYQKSHNNLYLPDDIVLKLDIEIKYVNYKKQFIDNFKEIATKNRATKQQKKGTIPYLFNLMKKKKDKANLINATGKYKKGTIPYFFKNMTKQESNKPTKLMQASNNNAKFFRDGVSPEHSRALE